MSQRVRCAVCGQERERFAPPYTMPCPDCGGEVQAVLHADRYRIDWPNERVIATGERSEDPHDFGYGSSYVFYTEGHNDGECEQFAWQGPWPVVRRA